MDITTCGRESCEVTRRALEQDNAEMFECYRAQALTVMGQQKEIERLEEKLRESEKSEAVMAFELRELEGKYEDLSKESEHLRDLLACYHDWHDASVGAEKPATTSKWWPATISYRDFVREVRWTLRRIE